VQIRILCSNMSLSENTAAVPFGRPNLQLALGTFLLPGTLPCLRILFDNLRIHSRAPGRKEPQIEVFLVSCVSCSFKAFIHVYPLDQARGDSNPSVFSNSLWQQLLRDLRKNVNPIFSAWWHVIGSRLRVFLLQQVRIERQILGMKRRSHRSAHFRSLCTVPVERPKLSRLLIGKIVLQKYQYAGRTSTPIDSIRCAFAPIWRLQLRHGRSSKTKSSTFQ
jgi:hypothetical protein